MDITPSTKVDELLSAYPQLEKTLIELSPSFAKLKNPVLRKTVAKVTSLQQAAKVGGLNIVDMIKVLRKHAGLPQLESVSELATDFVSFPKDNQMPEITISFDVRPLLDAGIHPKDEVVAKAESLNQGECLELITPFEPAPLIDILQKKGFKVNVTIPEPGVVKTYFLK